MDSTALAWLTSRASLSVVMTQLAADGCSSSKEVPLPLNPRSVPVICTDAVRRLGLRSIKGSGCSLQTLRSSAGQREERGDLTAPSRIHSMVLAWRGWIAAASLHRSWSVVWAGPGLVAPQLMSAGLWGLAPRARAGTVRPSLQDCPWLLSALPLLSPRRALLPFKTAAISMLTRLWLWSA
jgi:hypothetical protein